MKVSIIFSILIAGTFVESGNSEPSIGKRISCRLYDLIYPLFGAANPDLNYYLYTQNNPQNACDLQPTAEALKKCEFNPKSKTKVIIHGWVPHIYKTSPVFDLKDKLLQVENYNVVVFNWTAYSNTYNYTSYSNINYDIAVVHSVYVALKLSSWIHFLQTQKGADLKDFHLISHSLGAEVSSYAAKTLCNLERITFLDAAAPRFRYLPQFLQPSSSDADLVEAIHTDGALYGDSGYGYLLPIADIDYYPNGGQMQSKCYHGAKFKTESGEMETVKSNSTQRSCNHEAAYSYYISSFNETCEYLGLICNNYEDYVSGKCSRENSTACRMGFFSKRIPQLPALSKCFLHTSAESPYCLN